MKFLDYVDRYDDLNLFLQGTRQNLLDGQMCVHPYTCLHTRVLV